MISDLFAALSKVASEAVISSIWCTCETSGQNSNSKVFLTCLCCRISSCRECCGSIAGYQLDGHDVHEVYLQKTVPLVYGLIEHCMYKQVLLNPNGTLMDETDWMAVMSDPIISTLKVEGFDPMPSFRVEMGLTDDADRAIRTHVL